MSKSRPLSFELDFQSGLPAYLQVVRQVERLAAAGRLSAGQQLPTVRALARQLGLNFNTVARAYRSLHAAGLVTSQCGRGTFVVAAWSPGNAARLRRRLVEALATEFVQHSRRHGFTDREITSALRRGLSQG